MEVMQFLNRSQRCQPSAQALVYFRDPGFLRYLLLLPSQIFLHRKPGRFSPQPPAPSAERGNRSQRASLGHPRSDLRLSAKFEGTRALSPGRFWRLVPASGLTPGVSLVVSSVPDAWKPDFISESEETAHRVSELKRYLHQQKEVTCRG